MTAMHEQQRVSTSDARSVPSPRPSSDAPEAASGRRRTPVQSRVERLLVAMFGVDVFALVISSLLAWQLRGTVDQLLSPISSTGSLIGPDAPWVVVLWASALVLGGAYSPRLFGAGVEEYRKLVSVSFFAAGGIAATAFMTKSDMSRGYFSLMVIIAVPLMLVGRAAIRAGVQRARRQGHLRHRVVAVGGPMAIAEVGQILRRESYVGFEIVGVCLPEGVSATEDELPAPLLGTVGDTRAVCEQVQADTVLVAGGGYRTGADLRRIGWDLEGTDVDLVVVPSLVDVAGPRVHTRMVAGVPLMHVDPPQVDEAGGAAKRLFDVVVSGLILLVLSPALVAIALAVKLGDGGPVLFRQPRVGREGSSFDMLKFRSMVVDAEARLAEIRHLNQVDGTLFKMKDDPRITRIGGFLRRYSLDELPQLLNVLKGDMSLVGPRPPLPREVAEYADDVHRRLLVRPGMTGLWQVSGRSDLPFAEAVRLDLYYVDNWSMVNDLLIMLRTFRAVVGSSGAY